MLTLEKVPIYWLIFAKPPESEGTDPIPPYAAYISDMVVIPGSIIKCREQAVAVVGKSL